MNTVTEKIQFQLLAGNACFRIARELHQLLSDQGFSPSQLALIEPEDLLQASFHPSSCFVMVYDDIALLARIIEPLRKRFPEAVMLFVNVFPSSTSPSSLLVAGYDDFLPFPFFPDPVASKIRANLTRNHVLCRQEVDQTKHQLKVEVGLSDLIGKGPSFMKVLQEIVTLARTEATVLILGETGTGKDLCARAIHYTGPRASKPFLPVNCGGVPEDLFENEFFGHERGAYTDAREKFSGLIHEAEGGTIFLDDIESLSLKNQAKLLRFLEATEYMPLGSSKMRRSNVRVMASTNVDLAQYAHQGLFREDLYFRLAVITLLIPPLRARREDVPVLAEHFAARFSAYYGKSVALSTGMLEQLSLYPWPGNVRELQNLIHRAVVHASGAVVEKVEFHPDDLTSARRTVAPVAPATFSIAKKELVDQFEREYIVHLLEECDGNVSEAARRAGKNRRAFWEIMRKHNIHRGSD